MLREKITAIQAKGKIDREWWDKERASIQSQFMKELDEDASNAEASKPAPTSAAGGSDRVGSDEDAVLVEGGGPASSGSAAGKGGKKRKGKK